jgi:DNA-directed RNA polymerase subunit H (RpoH/RPB5)
MESRGFETAKYRNISPKEVEAMSVAQNTLNMILPHKDVEGKAVHVVYSLSRMTSRQKVTSTIQDYITSLRIEDNTDTELVLLINDPVSDMHHSVALQYTVGDNKGIRVVSIFCIYNIVNNPLEHVLVPPHTIVPQEEHPRLMESLMIQSKGQLPMIKFHQDMIARCIGLSPGDIVKIDRPSISTGIYTTYRVCVP